MRSKLALKLLFQFRIPINGDSGIYRNCEIRYVVIELSENESVCQAIDRFYAEIEENENFVYQNTHNDTVLFEFVGVMDYILWDFDNGNQFWYDYKKLKLPMENKSKFTMSQSELKRKITEVETDENRQTFGRRFDINNRKFFN